MRQLFFVVIISAFFVSVTSVLGSHLRCGEIMVTPTGNPLIVQIELRVYTAMAGTSVLFGGDHTLLSFGDGRSTSVPQQINSGKDHLGRPLPVGVGYASYKVLHQYNGYGQYIVSYREPTRNPGVINYSNSANTIAYWETVITLDAMHPFKGSPRSLTPPLFNAITSSPYRYSMASEDPGTNLLVYELVMPLAANRTSVSNYVFPDGITMNPFTGFISWENRFRGAYVTGEYLIAAKVSQYDTTGGRTRLVGYVYREAQILLQDGASQGLLDDDRVLDATNRILADVNMVARTRVFATPPTGGTVSFSVFSSLPQAALSAEPADSIADGNLWKVIRLGFTHLPVVTRDAPYLITVRADFGGFQKDFVYSFFTKDKRFQLPVDINPVPVSSDDDLLPGRVIVYPNPADEVLSVEGIKNCRAVAVSTAGYVFHLSGAGNRFDTSVLPPGVYIIRLLSPAGVMLGWKKIVKQ